VLIGLDLRFLIALYYGLDARPLNRDQVGSSEFAVNSCFRKISCVRSQTVIEDCKALFNCLRPPQQENINFYTSILRSRMAVDWLTSRMHVDSYVFLDNELCKLCIG